MSNDIKIIKSCQKGNKDSFNELINLYYEYVLGFLIKLTNNKQLSQDLTQDTFLKIIQNIDKFDTNGKASFSTYIITIAKNLYIDNLRKTKNEVYNIDELILPINGFEDESIMKFEYDDIMNQIEKLPEAQREAIKLKYVEGMTLKEIAKIHNTNDKTIKSRIHTGVSKLRRNKNEKR